MADLTEIDPEELLRKITEKEGHIPEDLAFIWFSPPCETNSSMNWIKQSRDRPERPVTWHRSQGGEAREGPLGGLARKHDIIVLKWTQWLTGQWGQAPDRSHGPMGAYQHHVRLAPSVHTHLHGRHDGCRALPP